MMKPTLSLLLAGALAVNAVQAHAEVGWICQFEPPKNDLGVKAGLQKYALQGSELVEDDELDLILSGKRRAYEIITNNEIGLIAIEAGAAEDNSAPPLERQSVAFVVIAIEKQAGRATLTTSSVQVPDYRESRAGSCRAY